MLKNGIDPFQIGRSLCNFGMSIGPITFINKIRSDVGYKITTVLQNTYGCRIKTTDIFLYFTIKSDGEKIGKNKSIYTNSRGTGEHNPELSEHVRP